jgi:hypothetical protein
LIPFASSSYPYDSYRSPGDSAVIRTTKPGNMFAKL